MYVVETWVDDSSPVYDVNVNVSDAGRRRDDVTRRRHAHRMTQRRLAFCC